MNQPVSSFDRRTATTIVIANMIGTGVFTSLGFQLMDITNPSIILFLWIIGGVIAFCGALCYAELGSAYPRSGGEYNFLRETYHPAAGFISGWVSVTVGFSAPTAAVAMTACAYLQTIFPHLPVKLTSITLVVVVGSFHLANRGYSAAFQQIMTFTKIIFIFLFMFLAWLVTSEYQLLSWYITKDDIISAEASAVAVALIFVNYAYTGWNAATYLIGEMSNPKRDLPKALLYGTGFVTLLYVFLHITFLSIAPMDEMKGQVEIAGIVADHAFGTERSWFISGMLSILLVSTISAMMIAGPRAMQVIGQDFLAFRLLAKTNESGLPYIAIISQMLITIVLIVTSGFEQIIVFAGSLLALNSLLTVIGVVILRLRDLQTTSNFRMPWYPAPVLVYSLIISATLVYALASRPTEAAIVAAVILSGAFVYKTSIRKQ